ncbi:AAA family ATPase [Aeromonas salmonicida]|uniref:AAA family ATPase n=1 Tax=Aeromonas salmonicida TaxID=645 RepID=UPI00223E941A|nr:AAA family ATPase [Aeromonas salmonicida]
MNFILVPRNSRMPTEGTKTAYLHIDHWNDFSFVTMFYLIYFDEHGVLHDLGNIKIGFKGQTTDIATYSKLSDSFENLPNDFFSLGEDSEYYRKISHDLPKIIRDELLSGLNDIVYNQDLLARIKDEKVFGTSLLRSTSISTIKGQLSRILSGDAELTPYNFSFTRSETESLSDLYLSFKVSPDSKPQTNIHAVIGRNGVGKTTLLNSMISSVIQGDFSFGYFTEESIFGQARKISSEYFSSIVSVSFSVFDPFNPPEEKADPSKGTCYYYIGLKQNSKESLKTLEQLHIEFYSSLRNCLKIPSKKERWLKAIRTLESDSNFAEMDLSILTNVSSENLKKYALHLISKMSSGHAIVILTITKLVEKVEEKTLLLIDEPESHLHPPLLSAFTRALSDLLFNRNGIAIIATHSPVLLQEIPKTCVSKITRYGKSTSISRPDIETFAENVGVLTREVFGLEVIKSGFHDLLQASVDKGGTYEDILSNYAGQLGIEGKFLLRTMISIRESQSGELK